MVNGSPSDQRSPSRSFRVRVRLLFDQAWLSAGSGSNWLAVWFYRNSPVWRTRRPIDMRSDTSIMRTVPP